MHLANCTSGRSCAGYRARGTRSVEEANLSPSLNWGLGAAATVHFMRGRAECRALFSRLEFARVKLVRLKDQFRMHPTIAAFPAKYFYDGAMTSNKKTATFQPTTGFPWPGGNGIAFVECAGVEHKCVSSCYNVTQVDLVVKIVAKLNRGCALTDIGVVAPYRAQVERLQAALPASVEVASVDQYQGREKEVLVYSTVRSSAASSVGWVSDRRRINVAFTRGRRGLVVVGNSSTLRRDTRTWDQWLDWVAEEDFALPEEELTSHRK